MLAAVLVIGGCKDAPVSRGSVNERSELTGAWHSKVTFRSGPLTEAKNLEFLYSYNAGGTMTESSNYDEAANSSPPAYGVWKRIDSHTFQTKYLFFMTKASTPVDSLPTKTDWWPAGHGVLTETITMSDDGQAYTSTIKLAAFGVGGAPVAGDGEGAGAGKRIVF
ncbi:MAG: hypothetical protein ABJB66_20410 [Gemmatimonadaceae bacterium]